MRLESMSTMSRAKMSPFHGLKFREGIIRVLGYLPSNLYLDVQSSHRYGPLQGGGPTSSFGRIDTYQQVEKDFD